MQCCFSPCAGVAEIAGLDNAGRNGWANTQAKSSSNDEDVDDQAPGPAQSTEVPGPAGRAAAAPVDCCEVCLVAPRQGFALVPCVYTLVFVKLEPNGLKRVAKLPAGCPVCRAAISMIMRVFC